MRSGNFSNKNKKTPGFNSWRAMWERCTYPKHAKYHLYGGRGITVCERWRSFAAFMEDMGPRPSNKHSIERKDSNGNYEPGNCVWATQTVQMRNTSINVYLTHNGETLAASEWAQRLGIDPIVLHKRKRRGWTDADALTIPPEQLPADRPITFDGKTLTISGWAKLKGIKKSTLFQRLDGLKWSVEKSLTTPVRPISRAPAT